MKTESVTMDDLKKIMEKLKQEVKELEEWKKKWWDEPLKKRKNI